MKDEMEDQKIESALKHFRESMHAWSEEEFAKPRAIAARPGGLWRAMANPIAVWTLTGALVVTGIAVPTGIHHQHQVEAARVAAQLEQQRINAVAAQRQAMLSMNDDELMSHVDSDIAQATPDAMQPLASLMADTDSQ
jgi:hypothetical protein